jgi:predicted N-formylglutamate amidohydrolase
MEAARHAQFAPADPVRITNRAGRSPLVLICDHASNFLPAQYGRLGLETVDLSRHIAWDPGALAVAARMAETLDAVLVQSCISRLVIDCNRPLDALDLICPVSETTAVPGNAALSRRERENRIKLSWRPFHDAIEEVVSERLAQNRETMLVSVHSFNPVYRGENRPWHIGILHDEDERLSRPLIAALQPFTGITVGDNEPYSPADRVYFTLERHGRSRGLPCVMIEIRNDEISGEAGQRKWAERLSRIFTDLEPDERQEPNLLQGAVHSAKVSN